MPQTDSVAILCYPTVGGSGRIACELAKGLVDAGVDVRVVSYEAPAFLEAAVRFEHVEVLEYPLLRYPPYDQALAAKICELHEREGVVLFHAHYAVPHAVAVLLADAMLGGDRLRLVTTLHGTDITLVGRDPAYRRAVLWALEKSHVVTAVSESLAEDTRRLIGYEGPIEVVPNFVDTSVFRPGDAPRWVDRAFDEPRRLVHLSTFRPVKRVCLLIECMAELHKILPFRLELVGEGPDLEDALSLAAARGIADTVVRVGMDVDAAERLRDADLYVFTSLTESFGLGVLEALACRVPVVGPLVGGVPEVLGDPPAGCLVQESGTHDVFVRDLVAAMTDLLMDDGRYRELAARGPERALETFPFSKALARYRALYARATR